MQYTFEDVKPLLISLNEAGYQAYLTGGSVRDHLLYGNFNDIDITTDAKPLEIATVFNNKRYDKFAAKFGTFKGVIMGLPVEITTLRMESGYVKYRHPSNVSFIKDPELDSKRRDLTINAMYLDQFGTLLDYHGGQKDLDNKLLRLIGNPYERLEEDPVRILRLIRFQLEFNFKIEEETEKAMLEKSQLVDEISSERQKMELQKFLKIAKPSEIEVAFKKYQIEVSTKL